MSMGDPITAKLFNGQPSTTRLPSCEPTSKKRALNMNGGIRRTAKRCKRIEAKGVKRAMTVTLGETQRLLKRPARLGPILSGKFGEASTRSSA